MSTNIQGLVERVYREYLEPMDDLQPYSLLTSGLTDSAGAITEITYDDVPFRMVFKGDSADYRYNVDGTVNFRIDVEEVI